MGLDRHLPLAPGPVSGRQRVVSTSIVDADFFTTFTPWPPTAPVSTSFIGGNWLDASISNVTEAIASGLGYTSAFNPITDTGGFQRFADPSFLTTSVSPIS